MKGTIKPGRGTSGYYSSDVFRKYGPTAFPAGTHMHWNHSTDEERYERPEGNLNSLAAVITSAPVYDDENGLTFEFKEFSDHATQIKEKGPHIGLSIWAYGYKEWDVGPDGIEGWIVKSIHPSTQNQIDFVTKPGLESTITESASSKGEKCLLCLEVNLMGDQPNNESELREASTSHQTGDTGDQRIQDLESRNHQLLKEANNGNAKAVIFEGLSEANIPQSSKTLIREALLASLPLQNGVLDQDALRESLRSKIELVRNDTPTPTYPSIRGQGDSSGVAGIGSLQERAKSAQQRLQLFFS